MKDKFLLFRIKVKQSLSTFKLQGLSLTIVFMASLTILSVNIFNAVNRGKFNYETYVYEKQTLIKLQQDLDIKIDTYDYVTSDEFKELLLREGYGYAESNQTLYKIKDEPSIALNESKEYLKTNLDNEYTQWWLKLVF